MKRQDIQLDALGLAAPFLLWGAAFAILYAAHGFACGLMERQGSVSIGATRAALGLLLTAFLAAHAWLAFLFLKRWRSATEEPFRFVRLASFILAVAALPTLLWTGLPVLFLSICR